MKICVLQKIVCFGVFKSLLAINLKKLSGLGLQHIVCAISQFSWVHKKHKNCKQKSFLFLEKQKVSSVELSEKETYVSRRDCYPTFPHPNMNPKPWFPNQQVIPLSRWLLKPVGNYSYSLNWRLQITNNRKKSISHRLTVSSRRYNVDSWSQSEWHETFLIWALFFWARQKHVDGIFGNTCHSPRKQEKIERNYVNLNPL